MVNFKLRIFALLAAILLCTNFGTARAQADSGVDSILLLMQVQDSIDAAADTATVYLDAFDDEEFIMPPEPTRSRNWFKRNLWKKIDWTFFIINFAGLFIAVVIFAINLFKMRRERNDSYIIPVVLLLTALLASVVITFVLSLLRGLLPRYLYVVIYSVVLVVCFLVATKPKSQKKNND